MQTIVVFGDKRWKSLGERPEQFVAHLAKGHKILYVEEPVATAGSASCLTATQVQENVTVVVPCLSRQPAAQCADDAATSAKLIRRYLEDHGDDEYLAWFFSASFAGVLTRLSPFATIYDCSEDAAAQPPFQRGPSEAATQLLRKADLVIGAGPSLCTSMRNLHPDVICIPDGVDASRFSPFYAAKLPEHVAFAANLHRDVGRPRLGFHGAIDERLDYELVLALSDANPNWHVVLSGPVLDTSFSLLPRRKNIHLLDECPRPYLAHLIAQWDVCILPYATKESTRLLNPSQALQYLAYGRAVVASAVPDVRTLYGDALHIADGTPSFVEACGKRAFLHRNCKDLDRRLAAEVVQRHSWAAATTILDDALERLEKTVVRARRAKSNRERYESRQLVAGS